MKLGLNQASLGFLKITNKVSEFWKQNKILNKKFKKCDDVWKPESDCDSNNKMNNLKLFWQHLAAAVAKTSTATHV